MRFDYSHKYDYIRICLGYPDHENTARIIWRKWNGFGTGKFDTDLFGYKKVFAIDVGETIYKNQFLSPAIHFKKVLTLNLKREYWEQIRDFKKKFDFREIKPYWKKRLLTSAGGTV